MNTNTCSRCLGRGAVAGVACAACAGRGAISDSRVQVTPHLVKDLLRGGGQVFAEYRRVAPIIIVEMTRSAITTELS